MRTFTIIAILCSGFAPYAFAQSTPESIIDAFEQQFLEQGPQSAIDSLFATNEWLMRDQNTRDQIATQLANMLPLIGEYYGKERIITKQAGQSLVLHSYLFKFERQPVRFHFMFYRPEDEWGLYRFKFDDSFDVELEEAAKLYFMDLDRY